MIDAVATICIFVNDQDKAKAFYLDKLGFELHQDSPMGPDSRWIAVAPKGARTEVILYKMDENSRRFQSQRGAHHPGTRSSALGNLHDDPG